VQICAIVNKLWALDEIQNGGRRHLEFIIFVHFGQMVYFRWQPSTLLQNFIHLRQSAAEWLLFVQKSKMAAAAILNYNVVMLHWTTREVHLCSWNSPSNFVLIEYVGLLFEMTQFKISHIWLKMLIQPPPNHVFGSFDPQTLFLSSTPPKGPTLRWNTRSEP